MEEIKETKEGGMEWAGSRNRPPGKKTSEVGDLIKWEIKEELWFGGYIVELGIRKQRRNSEEEI